MYISMISLSKMVEQSFFYHIVNLGYILGIHISTFQFTNRHFDCKEAPTSFLTIAGKGKYTTLKSEK